MYYMEPRSAIEASMWLANGMCATPLQQWMAAYDVLGEDAYSAHCRDGTLDEWIYARLPERLRLIEEDEPCIAATASAT